MVTQPGDLDQRIDLQRKTETRDAIGGTPVVWSTLDTVWASVVPLSGRERDHADQAENPRNYRVVIRYRADLTTADRILWRSKLMAIRFIQDAGPRPLYLTLDVESGVQT